MRSLLADTHILLWALDEFERLPEDFRDELESPGVQPLFSVVSIWELAIKSNRKPVGFLVDARSVRAKLLDDGWKELELKGEHVLTAGALPLLHRDPFDRALVGQAIVERIELVTSDAQLGEYAGPVRVV